MLFAYVVFSGSGLSAGSAPGVGEAFGSWLGITSPLGVVVASCSTLGIGIAASLGAGVVAGSGLTVSVLGAGVSSVVSTAGLSVPAEANVPYTGIAPNVNTTASIRHSSLPDLEKLFRSLNLVSSLS